MTFGARELLAIAAEGLGRYKLRTALSVLGVILGVAAVIAMMSVSEGAQADALKQVELLGLDNLVVRNRALTRQEMIRTGSVGLTSGDAESLIALIPMAKAVSPLVERYIPVSRGGKGTMARTVGVRPSYEAILRLRTDRGRFLTLRDEQTGTRVCVLGASLAQMLFGFQQPIGEHVRLQADYYEVVGVLAAQGTDPGTPGTLAWRDLDQAVLTPLPALSGRSLGVASAQRVDEIWLQVREGGRVGEIGTILEHTLTGIHGGSRAFDIVIPRELLAQRYRTQRTFSIVVGSVAVLALLVGGIGIMNIMLTSVMERTREIGVRRTVGATRRDVTLQFLMETLLMTLTGGVLGIIIGVGVSWGITAYAGWSTRVSPLAVALAVIVSIIVGLVFGIYPAVKAAQLEPVDALRYE